MDDQMDDPQLFGVNQLTITHSLLVLIKMLGPNEINLFIKVVLNLNYDQFQLTVEEFQKLVFPSDRFVILDFIGKGKTGMVFKIRSREDEKVYALKVFQSMTDYKCQEIFAKHDMAPILHKVEVHRSTMKGVPIKFVKAIMDPIHSTLFQYLTDGKSVNKFLSAFECLIKKKYLLNFPEPYIHGDMHIENIVILKDKKTLGFIDFDWSIKQSPVFQVLDCIPLIGSIRESDIPHRNQICESLIMLYNKIFNITPKLNQFVSHPAGGYGYRIGAILLHSYDWVPDRQQNPFPTEMTIRSVFPRIQLPKVMD